MRAARHLAQGSNTFDTGVNTSLGETTVTIELTSEGEGTHLRLVETGWGDGDDWDRLYNAVDSGWSFFFRNTASQVASTRKHELFPASTRHLVYYG